jgi:hypothetical protein
MSVPTVVYILGFVASSTCAWLLVRGYLRHRTRLLLWSATCFVFLALNNATVVLDFVVLPQLDLGLIRVVTSLAGVLALLYGFIREVH